MIGITAACERVGRSFLEFSEEFINSVLRYKAAKRIKQTLENTTDTGSKNEFIMERPVDRQGKLTSSLFKLCHEEKPENS